MYWGAGIGGNERRRRREKVLPGRQTEVGQFSPVGWKSFERAASPHGNWQKCWQLATGTLSEKFSEIMSNLNVFYFDKNHNRGVLHWLASGDIDGTLARQWFMQAFKNLISFWFLSLPPRRSLAFDIFNERGGNAVFGGEVIDALQSGKSCSCPRFHTSTLWTLHTFYLRHFHTAKLIWCQPKLLI